MVTIRLNNKFLNQYHYAKGAIYHENIYLKPIIVTLKEYTLMKYKWLLFDADGTLFDYNKSEVEAIKKTFAQMGHEFKPGYAKTYRQINEHRMNDPQKKEVLIIGDSLTSDIRGGIDYGIDACWFNPTQKSCDLDIEIQYEIISLSELLHIVG